MGKTAPSDGLLARCVGSQTEPDLCPQSLIDLMPSANAHLAHLARLADLARDFMPPDPVLTCTTMRWWVDRIVAHLCTRDVHAASTTIQ